MNLNENDVPEFMRELRNLLGQIKGFKSLSETFSLSYVVVVDSEETKENVIKIANLLTQQAAQQHGIDLEITPATLQELQEAADLLKQHQAATKGSFVL